MNEHDIEIMKVRLQLKDMCYKANSFLAEKLLLEQGIQLLKVKTFLGGLAVGILVDLLFFINWGGN